MVRQTMAEKSPLGKQKFFYQKSIKNEKMRKSEKTQAYRRKRERSIKKHILFSVALQL